MKKILLLASIAFIGSQIGAQITITSSHVIAAGQKINQYSDTSKIKIQAGGAAQSSWDFSNLKLEDKTTMSFFNPDWNPSIGNLVAGANLVAEIDGDYSFLSKTNTSLKVVGVASDTGAGPLEVGSLNWPIMFFPMTYGTVAKDSSIIYSEKSYFGMSPGAGAPVIDSFEIIYNQRYTFKGVGYGSVKLPAGVNISNSIMIESLDEYYTIIKFYSGGRWSTLPTSYYALLGQSPDPDSSFSHIWWTTQDNYGFPLVQYEYDNGDDSVSYVDFISSSAQATALENTSAVTVSVYPNPSSEVLMFSGLTNENAKAIIMDMHGKMVLNTVLSNGQLNIQNLSVGNYVVQILDNGQMVNTTITKQ